MILGKYLGTMILLIVPLLIGMLFSMFIITTSDKINLMGEDWIKIAVVILLSILTLCRPAMMKLALVMPLPESRGESQEPPKEIDAPIPPIHTPLEDSDKGYASSLHAEQIPLAIAAFVCAKGEPRVAIPTTCMIGRDADSTATTVGSWVGALHGVSGLPKEWVDVVSEALHA